MHLKYYLIDGTITTYTPKVLYKLGDKTFPFTEDDLWSNFYYRKEFVIADNNQIINKKHIIKVELISE